MGSRQLTHEATKPCFKPFVLLEFDFCVNSFEPILREVVEVTLPIVFVPTFVANLPSLDAAGTTVFPVSVATIC